MKYSEITRRVERQQDERETALPSAHRIATKLFERLKSNMEWPDEQAELRGTTSGGIGRRLFVAVFSLAASGREAAVNIFVTPIGDDAFKVQLGTQEFVTRQYQDETRDESLFIAASEALRAVEQDIAQQLGA